MKQRDSHGWPSFELGLSKITCCIDCKDRFPACHSTCEKYKAQKEQIERIKKAKSEQYNSDIAAITRKRFYKKLKKEIKKK